MHECAIPLAAAAKDAKDVGGDVDDVTADSAANAAAGLTNRAA